jgi:hypothetical protein
VDACCDTALWRPRPCGNSTSNSRLTTNAGLRTCSDTTRGRYEDDAIAGSKSPNWADRDGPTDASVQMLHQPPLDRAGDRGGRLRNWMEGWRICGTAMEDARPLNLLTRADPAHPFLKIVAARARQGELAITRATRIGRLDKPVMALMRILLLPRAFRSRETSFAGQIPRLLDTVLP